MEAWKFFNYSNISPLFALGFTTERWGLEPFPGNLVAIPGYFDGKIEEAWALPYSCLYSDLPSYDYEYYYADGDWIGEQPSIVNITSSTICEQPLNCDSSGCVILIEGIGDTFTGPAHSNIVGLVHGISSFLVLLSTIIIIGIMGGCFSSNKSSYDPNAFRSQNVPASRVTPDDLRPYSQPQVKTTSQSISKFAEQIISSAEMADEIERCTDLLREMYGLDLMIWGQQYAVDPAEIQRREASKFKANSLYNEVRRLVYGWNDRPREDLNDAEWRSVQVICEVINRHGKRRY